MERRQPRRSPLVPKQWQRRLFSFEKTRAMLKRSEGSALMLALFTVTLLIVISMEILYESNVEFIVSSNSVNQVKAYYAARAGAEISLLRLHIYKKALANFGDSIPDKSLFDMIWSMPFMWPPVIPKDTNSVDKAAINKVVKASTMKSAYLANIFSEGSKIDVNDLDSPSKVMRDAVHQEILQIFKTRLEADDQWATDHHSFNFDHLIDNIADYIDADSDAKGGGAESQYYRNFKEGMPPNRPLQSLQELHMVAEMTDDIYDIIAPELTVFGIEGINVNHASENVLESLDSHITADVAKKIVEARNDPQRGPFKDIKDFVEYLNGIGVPGNPFVEGTGADEKPKLPLVFDSEMNFKIESIGTSGKVQRKITAIVFDFDRVKDRLSAQLKSEAPPAPPPNPPNPPNPSNPPAPGAPPPVAPPATTPAKITAPTDRPNVVYWIEE